MKTIWKFLLQIHDRQFVEMPKGAIALSVQNQNGTLCLWALCDPVAPTETRGFKIFGTGRPIESVESLQFIGTVQVQGGHLVWHVFEILT